jgi:hypothetical protein
MEREAFERDLSRRKGGRANGERRGAGFTARKRKVEEGGERNGGREGKEKVRGDLKESRYFGELRVMGDERAPRVLVPKEPEYLKLNPEGFLCVSYK